MDRIAGTPAQSQAPRTRWGGKVTLGGREFATAAELEEALEAAVEDAGATRWRLTRRGWELAAAFEREAGR